MRDAPDTGAILTWPDIQLIIVLDTGTGTG